jgi:UDP-N-acetylglucosamine acyltransferase
MSGARLTGLVTVDSGTDKRTIIGRDCLLLKKSHVGHDAIICEGTTLSCNSIVGGHTIVGKHCNIGLGAILHQKIKIPDYVMIGMGGIVTKKSNLESFKIYAGNPVKYLSDNKVMMEKFKKQYDWHIQNRISER